MCPHPDTALASFMVPEQMMHCATACTKAWRNALHFPVLYFAFIRKYRPQVLVLLGILVQLYADNV